MENYRKSNRSFRRGAIDGVLSRGAGEAGKESGFKRASTSRPTQAPVDNFRAMDGFYASNRIETPLQSKQSEVDQLHNMALNMDEVDQASEPKKKRRALLHRPKSWPKTILRSFVIVLVLAVVAGGFLFGKGYLKARNVFKGGSHAAVLDANVDPSHLKGEGDGRVNILILGKGGAGHDGPDLTDTLIILSIDPINKQASLLSVPRDLWIKAPGYGEMKINAAYANAKYAAQAKHKSADDAEKAGISEIESVVQSAMGIPIHYYAMIDFEAFRKAVDTVGGIDVDVKTKLSDPTMAWENKEKHFSATIADVGINHFDGYQALMYARSRHGSARGDFDRADRQREIIVALKQKMLSIGTFSNPLKISQLMDAFGDHVRTDLDFNDMASIYQIMKDISPDSINSVGLADPPNNYVTTGTINDQSVVIPRAGSLDFSEIQNYVRNALKDGFIAKENANILVLNGTTVPGLAKKKSDELKTYGYNITQGANAPTQDYTKSVLVDLTNGQKKYSLHYLQDRMGVTPVSKVPDPAIVPGQADFVIILGQDEATN